MSNGQTVSTTDAQSSDQSTDATPDAPPDEAGPDEQLSTSPRARWEWLSSIVAGVTVLSFIGYMLGLAYQPAPIVWPGGTIGYAYVAVVLATVTYAIGEDVVGIFKQLRGGGK